MPFQVNDLAAIVPETLRGSRPVHEVTMTRAQLNDGQTLYAVNDLFIGQRTHVSARYQIVLGSKKEQHSSSGIIVSTGLGSTAWLKSIVAGAATIVKSISQTNLNLKLNSNIRWDIDYLFFSVREPFPSKTSQAGLVFGQVKKNTPLKIVSQMPDNGVIFSDGIENDFLNFNSGVEATISVAPKRGHLVM